MTIAHLTITALYAGLTALLLVCTSIFVTMGRVKYKVNLGDGGNAAMLQRIRVQGNLVEYAPTALILMGLLEMGGTAAWVLHTLGIALIVGRLLHAYAIYQGPKPGAARGIGTTATWLVILAGGVLSLAMTQGWLLK
jgi:uncharacterized membrane protein YecN with MAPEG domain